MLRSVRLIEHLVAGDTPLAGNAERFIEVADIEIADAPAQILPSRCNCLERRDGLGQRMRPAPMQQVAVQPVGAEARKRARAGLPCPGSRRVLRQHLGHQKDLVAAAGNGLADPLFGRTRPVHLGGVDMVHAEVEPSAQCRDRRVAGRLLEIPGAEPDHRRVTAGRAERSLLHRSPPGCREKRRLVQPRRRARPFLPPPTAAASRG